MSKSLKAAAVLAMSAALLTGCGSVLEALEQSSGYTDVEKIDYNLYRISGTRVHVNQTLQLREFLYQRAQDFCMRHSQGAQLLDAVSGKNPSGEGVRAELIFRCVGIMKAPPEEFIDRSPEADAERQRAALEAKEKAQEQAEEQSVQ